MDRGKGRSQRKKNDKEKEQDWSAGPDVMTTGRVVGVLQRGWTSYIASMPRAEEEGMDKLLLLTARELPAARRPVMV